MKVLIDCAAQEQDEDHRSRNPEWAIEIRVSLQYIEEVRSGVECCPTPREYGTGINIEELRVEA
jgi:hypothetical protein